MISEDGPTEYEGEYTSNLDYDGNGFSWWESEDHAIWWADHAWRVGPKANREEYPTEAGIISTATTPCPHIYYSSGTLHTNVWKYKDTKGDWVNGEKNELFADASKFTRLLVVNQIHALRI